MPIVTPSLPPKSGYSGYIESRDLNGEPIYIPTKEHLEKEKREFQIAALRAESIQVKAQLLQTDETAITLFEAQLTQDVVNTQQDEAIIAIYEMIGGTSV